MRNFDSALEVEFYIAMRALEEALTEEAGNSKRLTRTRQKLSRVRVNTRDSILLTYFVDQGALKVLRNRGKRLGNFLLNEIRQWF